MELGEILEGTKHHWVNTTRCNAIIVVNNGEVIAVVINVIVAVVMSLKDNHVIMIKNIK